MIDMKEWLISGYEEGDLTKSELRAALTDRRKARDLWVEFCDSEDWVEECQFQVERFLEMVDDVE